MNSTVSEIHRRASRVVICAARDGETRAGRQPSPRLLMRASGGAVLDEFQDAVLGSARETTRAIHW